MNGSSMSTCSTSWTRSYSFKRCFKKHPSEAYATPAIPFEWPNSTRQPTAANSKVFLGFCVFLCVPTTYIYMRPVL